ncbi:MAG: precorrin-6A reductase [Lachnospiraceae bacterium]|nr:precorrin-6A reductase [Lachnospiraceae bacterium]
MKKILLFAGTTEGRELSERLSSLGLEHTVSVATEYGEIVLKEDSFSHIHKGRMDCEEIKRFIVEGDYAVVVDATHPYARIVTDNILKASSEAGILYLRLKRDSGEDYSYDGMSYYDDNGSCAKALMNTEGNILLTTGSKELEVYCRYEGLKDRLFVRVLPSKESLDICASHGIKGRQILALQGPFTKEMNEAMIRQYDIRHLVTKKSGINGGYGEKVNAAISAGISIHVIDREDEDNGLSFEEVCRKIEGLCDACDSEAPGTADVYDMRVILAGVGMGSKDNLTCEVQRAIAEADIILGAGRMIEEYEARVERKALYKAEDIVPYLCDLQANDKEGKIRTVVILFSGDSGFYSGCRNLSMALQQETEAGRLRADLRIMPGISSVSYLASKVGISYDDAAICSIHGKNTPNLPNRIRSSHKTFLLMSGVEDLKRLGRLLIDNGMNTCRIWAGFRLSYPDERIEELTPDECIMTEEDGLYTCLIINPEQKTRLLTHGTADQEFIRDKVPMTKEEVRDISICKLKLNEGSVLYDIGSGTGSVAIEAAALSDSIKVYAIERKEEALKLIEENRRKFSLDNISIITGVAPNALEGLPVPTHAFIGGSGGRMRAILDHLYQISPGIRVVINAISMETICELKEILSSYPVRNEDIVQVQVSRSRTAGDYHIMQAENPVWIASFDLGKGEVV